MKEFIRTMGLSSEIQSVRKQKSGCTGYTGLNYQFKQKCYAETVSVLLSMVTLYFCSAADAGPLTTAPV